MIDPKLYHVVEALFDDEAVMRGVVAVRKLQMMRVGDQHDHAEAFRKALIESQERVDQDRDG